MIHTTHQLYYIRAIPLLILVFLMGTSALAQTPISGNLSGSLTLSGSPYLVTASSNVIAGETLTIEAGVTVLFNPSTFITVTGTLISQGSNGSPVLFTSVSPSPEPGDWMAIFAQNNASIQFTHTWLEYAGASGYAALETTSGTPVLVSFDGGGVRNCLNSGLHFRGNDINLQNLLVHNNGGDGISVTPNHPTQMQNLQANNNGGYAMRINQNPCHIQSGLSGTGNGFNGIYVTGTLGGSEPAGTWNWTANPMFPVIIANLTIGGDDRLVVAPGSVIKFVTTGSNINVTGGHLDSLADPGGAGFTWFTSLKDDAHGGDTNGDGPSTGSGADWMSIFMQNNSTLNLRDAFVGYGGSSGYASLTTTSGTMVSLDWDGGGCVGSSGDGIRLKSTTSFLSNMTIENNGSDGFELNSTVPAVLSNLVINNNGAYCGRLTTNPGNLDGTITGSGNAFNGVYVTGTLGGGEVAQQWNWNSSSSVPVIVANLTVTGNDTLSIDPGTVVKFNTSGSSMNFTGGMLSSPGGTPAWFTSLKDDTHGGDTNNDGSATSPAPADWQSVFMQNLSTVDLNDLWMAYGGSSGYANMTTTSGTVANFDWDGGGLAYGGTDGARVHVSRADVRNLTLDSNVQDGFEINSNTPPEFGEISAINNGAYGLRVTANPGNLPSTMTGSGNGFNGIYVTGTLGGGGPAGVWSWSTVGEFPAIISTVNVNAGHTLSVTGGSVVKFNTTGSWINFTGGTFHSPGGDPVWFTSIKDDSHGGDTNNDGSSSSPAPGDWMSAFMQNLSIFDLNNTWFAYGGSSGYANVTTTSGTMTSMNWNGGGLIGSATDGARIHPSQADLRNLTFDGNLQDGLEINSSTPPEFANIIARNNGAYGMRITANPGNIPASFSGSGNGFNGIYTTGNLGGGASDQEWIWSGGSSFPVIVAAVTVTGNDTLTVAEGAIIKFNTSGSNLNITNGTLRSTGGVAAWITSIKDDAHGGDTNGDGAATSPAPGDWMSVFVQNLSKVDLNNTWLAYGGSSGYANITTTSGTVAGFLWDGGGTAFSANDGVRISTSSYDINQIRAINNAADGLQLSTQTTGAVHNSELTGNGALAMRNSSTSHIIAASGNWWGDASGPLDLTDGNPDYNPGGLGQPVSDYVDYRPWMPAAPISSPPGSFQALLPGAGEVFQTGPVVFTWSNSVDPDGDTVIYSLEISRTAEFDDIYLIQGGVTDLSASIDTSELEPDHTSWWRIIARDGNFNQTTADPGLRAIVQGNDLSPVPDTTQFAFSVGNIWPNPSSINSSLSFSLPKSQDIRLQVFDVRGRLVQTLVDDSFDAGVHVVRWNGRDRSGNRAANGLYFYRLQTDNGNRVRRLVMVR